MKVSLVCRVCGRDFTASRFDALTCTSTCRQRLRRGGEFAYFAGLSKRQQRLEREMHDAYGRHKAAHKEAVAATRAARDLNRKARHERLLAEIVGREVLNAQRKEAWQKMRNVVAAVRKLFAEKRRSDCSAQAIADYIANDLELPDEYPVEVVAELLAEIEAIHAAAK